MKYSRPMNWSAIGPDDVVRVGDLDDKEDVPRLTGCPDCDGRGWFFDPTICDRRR